MSTKKKSSTLLAGEADRRAGIYGVIAAVYARPADWKLIDLLRGWYFPEDVHTQKTVPPQLASGLHELQEWFGQTNPQTSKQIAEMLSPEFTRLFRGIDRKGSPPPPYESVYLDGGRLFGPSTGAVSALLGRYGLKPEIGEPPDHISLELELMRFFCASEAAAWREQKQAAEWLNEESSFLNEHLLKWIPAFCGNVRKSDKTGFYKAFTDITEGWLEYERDTVGRLADGSTV